MFTAAMIGLVLALSSAAQAAQPVISDRNVPIEAGSQREVLIEGLERPWGMAWLPDGTLLITERTGRLRVVRDGKLDPAPVAGVPEVFAGGQGGLMDVSVHPRFAETKFIYLTTSVGTMEANRTRVVRATWADGRLENVTTLFENASAKPSGQHFGARIAWLPDGTMLVPIGDGGNPPVSLNGEFIRLNAQKTDMHFGKVVRLRDDGQVPADNPFRSQAGARPELWTIGHRNIQGLAYDPLRNAVWATEHGALGGDEFNRLTAGGNFGWPAACRTREYASGRDVCGSPAKPGTTEPVLLWQVSTAPSGLMVYTGDAFPQWRGDVFAGGLASNDIRRIDLDDAGAVIGETAIRMGARVRDVRQGPDGLVYVLTDEPAGRLFRLSPAAAGATPAPIAPPPR
ncbi:MAG: PQQ-dependent sugar dehydrogenase [Rhodospirillaceae bacterium]|nr:PQQ-dependent sugar dehydrogenase [Rhodospirillaceae bacterium]